MYYFSLRQQCWLIVAHCCGGLSILPPPVDLNWFACLQTLQLRLTQRLRIFSLSSCQLIVRQQPKYTAPPKIGPQAIFQHHCLQFPSPVFSILDQMQNSELRSSLSSMTRILVRAWVRIRDHYQAGVWSASLTRHYNRTKPAVSSRNPHYAISTSFSCSKRHFRLGQK